MVTNLISCLESFKTKMEYKNVDFNADRPVQHTALREDMAKPYSGVDVALFGPVTVTQPRVPFRDMNKEEKAAYLKITKEVRVKEKVKEIKQSFSRAVTTGSKSGTGKLVSSPGLPTGAEFSHIKRS